MLDRPFGQMTERCAVRLFVVGVAVSLFVVGSLAAGSSAAGRTADRGDVRLVKSYKTVVYDVRGKVLYTLDGSCDDSEEYCTSVRGPRSRVIYVSLTHTTCGGAVRVSQTTWRVWSGRRFMGTIIKRNGRHADIYTRTGRKRGYAVGALPVRTAAFDLIVGVVC